MDIKKLKALITEIENPSIKTIAEKLELSYGAISKKSNVATYKDLTSVEEPVLEKICEVITKMKK